MDEKLRQLQNKIKSIIPSNNENAETTHRQENVYMNSVSTVSTCRENSNILPKKRLNTIVTRDGKKIAF